MIEKFGLKIIDKAKQVISLGERQNDILIGNKSLFEQEKTLTQIETIQTAGRFVSNHLKKLGIENTPFDEKRVVLTNQQISELNAAYHRDADFITVPELLETNLAVFVHEFTHAQSAEWRNFNEDDMEDFLKNSKIVKIPKAGFHRTNFRFLNEGITEKITRDIMSENIDEVSLFRQSSEIKANQVVAGEKTKKTFFPSFRINNKAKKHGNELTKSYGVSANTCYNFNVELISYLVEGISKYNIKNKITVLDLSEERGRVWNEFQGAYFKNTTMYLRKIDQVFGKGFLRKEIDDDFLTNLTDDEQSLYLDRFKNEIAKM